MFWIENNASDLKVLKLKYSYLTLQKASTVLVEKKHTVCVIQNLLCIMVSF